MVSKCANPECNERFLYLHQGKLYHLTPSPEVAAAGWDCAAPIYERFWLCERCCQKMTLVWGGTEAKLVSVPTKQAQAREEAAKSEITVQPRSQAAIAGSSRP